MARLLDGTTVYGTVYANTGTLLYPITTTSNTTTVATTAFVKSYGGFRGQIVITTAGTGATGTIPSFGISKLKVTVVGGGGAGGGSSAAVGACGGGGGGGGISTKYLTTASGYFDGLTYTYTIGTAATGASGANGNNGVASSFALAGTTITAGGGVGGAFGNGAVSGAGGAGVTAGTGGDINLPGQPGQNSAYVSVTLGASCSGGGGGGLWGTGGAVGKIGSGTGNVAGTAGGVNTGGGGSGSIGATTPTAGTGGAGGIGIIIIEF
jgi:hypothetical protein